MCRLLIVSVIFIMLSLICRGLVCVVLPFRSWTTSLGFYLNPVML